MSSEIYDDGLNIEWCAPDEVVTAHVEQSTANDGSARTVRQAELLRQLEVLYGQLAEVRQANQASENEVVADSTATRLILVSQKLPFTLAKVDGQWRADSLDSILANHTLPAYLDLHDRYHSLWVGASTSIVDPAERHELQERLLQQNYSVIFLDQKRLHLWYKGFCKTVLWPLFHSTPLTTDYHIDSHDSDMTELSEEKMWMVSVAPHRHVLCAYSLLANDKYVICVIRRTRL